MSASKSESARRKQDISQLQKKIKTIKENVATTRRTLRKARADLGELLELEKAAIVDEKERIDAAYGDISTALGRDKYDRPILPGSFWSDVYITRRNREILAPGLRNTIKRCEKHLAKYEQEIIDTRKALRRLQFGDLTAVFFDFSTRAPEAEVSEPEVFSDHVDEAEADNQEEFEAEITTPFNTITEKSVMLDRLEKISDDLKQYDELLSKKEIEKARILAELRPMHERLSALKQSMANFTSIENNFLYRLITILLGFLGFKIGLRQKYENDQNEAKTLEEKISSKETLLNEVNTTLNEVSRKKRELLEEQSFLKKSIGGITKERVHQLMLQIIFRDKVPEIEKLIKKCEQFRLDYVGRHLISVTAAATQIKAALRKFLEEPTKMNLDQLNQILHDNPLYSKSFSLFRLVRDSSIFYPGIRMTTEPLIPIKSITLDEPVSQQIGRNKSELIDLQRQLSEIDSHFKMDISLISKALQNKEALENAYIAQAVLRKHRDLFIKNNPLSALEKKLTAASNSVIAKKIQSQIEEHQMVLKLYEEKIRDVSVMISHIKANLSNKNIREINKKFIEKTKRYEERKVIDPFVEGKSQSERLELLQLLNQVAIVSIQVEDAEASMDIDIPYIADSALKEVVLEEGVSEKIDQRFALQEKVNFLEDENRRLEEDALSVGQSLQITQLNALIERCRQKTLLNYPITKALGRFLMIPTTQNLDVLIDKMKRDHSYTNNHKLLSILREATELYPVLIKYTQANSQDSSAILGGVFKGAKEGLRSLMSTPSSEIKPVDKPNRGH